MNMQALQCLATRSDDVGRAWCRAPGTVRSVQCRCRATGTGARDPCIPSEIRPEQRHHDSNWPMPGARWRPRLGAPSPWRPASIGPRQATGRAGNSHRVDQTRQITHGDAKSDSHNPWICGALQSRQMTCTDDDVLRRATTTVQFVDAEAPVLHDTAHACMQCHQVHHFATTLAARRCSPQRMVGDAPVPELETAGSCKLLLGSKSIRKFDQMLTVA